ncbi:MAG: hypothetical protein COA80_06060 [Leeuwenhoekiella sp.]|nr:MAG: hypothetical protein COA80_06060 [Leeuwenhoekiella sp.]
MDQSESGFRHAFVHPGSLGRSGASHPDPMPGGMAAKGAMDRNQAFALFAMRQGRGAGFRPERAKPWSRGQWR